MKEGRVHKAPLLVEDLRHLGLAWEEGRSHLLMLCRLFIAHWGSPTPMHIQVALMGLSYTEEEEQEEKEEEGQKQTEESEEEE